MNTDKYIPRKMGIALATIWVLKDIKAASRIDLAVIGCITIISTIGIIAQWNLDKGIKVVDKPDDSDIMITDSTK